MTKKHVSCYSEIRKSTTVDSTYISFQRNGGYFPRKAYIHKAQPRSQIVTMFDKKQSVQIKYRDDIYSFIH
jgi:hypothetical protein